jgi:hypothetical protein
MAIIEIGLFRTLVVVEIDEGEREFIVTGLTLPTTEDYHVSGTPEFSATWWIKPGTKTMGGFTGVLSDDAPAGGTRLVLMIDI